MSTSKNYASVVPGREHYSFEYLLDGRLYSYAEQLHVVLSSRPDSVLEVGVGSGMVAAALRAAGVLVTTLDVQSDLSPDIVGSVTAIPLDDDALDVGLCCQVLEHLPFHEFERALSELRRVVRGRLVMSLPDTTRHQYLGFRLTGLGERTVEWSRPQIRPRGIPPERLEKMGHHWEIGFAGFGARAVRKVIVEAGWSIAREWRVQRMPWHRFFDLRSNRN